MHNASVHTKPLMAVLPREATYEEFALYVQDFRGPVSDTRTG